MSCLVESIEEAMKNLPILSTYTGTDGMKYLEDSNLKDVCHLAETIRRVCNLPIDDLSSIQSLSKQQVIEIVELVEHELLSRPSIEPVKRSVVSDPLAIRVKQENQLIEELNKVGNEVLKKCPQIGSAIEDAVVKSLFIWHRTILIVEWTPSFGNAFSILIDTPNRYLSPLFALLLSLSHFDVLASILK
jgi:hypothetical protein